jgi:hypothetical protein
MVRLHRPRTATLITLITLITLLLLLLLLLPPPPLLLLLLLLPPLLLLLRTRLNIEYADAAMIVGLQISRRMWERCAGTHKAASPRALVIRYPE